MTVPDDEWDDDATEEDDDSSDGWEHAEEGRQRVAEGEELGRTLIGVSTSEAAQRVRGSGFHCEVIPPDHQMLTMDFRPDRIRLFEDEDHFVTSIEAG